MLTGSDLAAIVTAVIGGVFALSAILIPLVWGKRAGGSADKPAAPDADHSLLRFVRNLRGEMHDRFDDIERIARRGHCPYNEGDPPLHPPGRE